MPMVDHVEEVPRRVIVAAFLVKVIPQVLCFQREPNGLGRAVVFSQGGTKIDILSKTG
jgi:hypothetical protein